MADPRLDSLHLDPARRQDYRRAREALLRARGDRTLCAEQLRDDGPPSFAHTVVQGPGAGPPPGVDCWLLDRDGLYPLKDGVNTLGRSRENDVVVEDAYVSRRHCVILVHHDRTCELHDTASKNGTYLNGRRLTAPSRLNPGDEIRVCGRQFVYLTRASAQSPTL